MRCRVLLSIALRLLAPSAASAELCSADDHPAATLLLPYFEVDSTRPDGSSTLISVVNTRLEPTLIKVVLWTELGVPSLDFEIYLAGLDVFTANLRDVLLGGAIPRTGPEVSPPGSAAFPDTPFPDCPHELGGAIAEGTRQAVVDFHLGRPSARHGGCGAEPRDDGIVRGFATIDVVHRCAALLPTDADYFDLEGVASYDNRLLGDALYVDASRGVAAGENLVRLEADTDRFGFGDRTFYAAFVDGNGADGREPLPTIWATRLIDGLNVETELTVWRGWSERPEAFACDGPLPQLPPINEVFSFDESGEGGAVFPQIGAAPAPGDFLPLASQRVRRSDFPFALPAPFGWLSLDLSHLVSPAAALDPLAQAWVGSTFSAGGLSAGLSASPRSDPCSIEGCALGETAAVGELCVSGPDGDPAIEPNRPLEVRIRPQGCFSSACTKVHRLKCSLGAMAGNTLRVYPRLCLSEDRRAEGCTADCANLEAVCSAHEGLPPGIYVLTAGALALTLKVPSTVPEGGLCADEAL